MAEKEPRIMEEFDWINPQADLSETETQQGSSEPSKKGGRKLTRDFKIQPAERSVIENDLIRLLMVIASAALTAFTFRFFTDYAGILPGGFNGLSKLLQKIAKTSFGLDIPFALLNLSFNAIPAIMSFFLVGRKFFFLSIIHVILTSVLMDMIPMTHVVDDIFLNVVFGAILYGVACGIALQANASAGGTDFVSMIFTNKYNITVWNYALAFNALVLTVSGFLYGFAPAMYSVILQAIMTMIINVLHTRYQKKTVFIIAPQAEPLSTDLMRLTGHGLTSFEGIGRYSGEKRTLIYMVVSKDDIPKIRKHLASLDNRVFMNISSSEDLDGNFYLKPFD